MEIGSPAMMARQQLWSPSVACQCDRWVASFNLIEHYPRGKLDRELSFGIKTVFEHISSFTTDLADQQLCRQSAGHWRRSMGDDSLFQFLKLTTELRRQAPEYSAVSFSLKKTLILIPM